MLLLLGFINEVGIPDLFTIDVTLIFIGYNLGFSSVNSLALISALLIGQLLGASVIYLLSLALGNNFSRWLCNKAPKLERRLIDLEGKLDEHAIAALLFLRLGPGINTAASMAAGLANIEYRKFALSVLISILIADGARFIAGFAAFQGITILGIQPQTWQIVAGIILVLALFWLSTYRIKTWADKRYPKTRAAVHSPGFSNRSCPLPEGKSSKPNNQTKNPNQF